MPGVARRSLLALVSAMTGVCVGLMPEFGACEAFVGSEFEVRSWDRRDGLPPVVVRDIQRTPNGYLWLATERGLVRFDGARFKSFDVSSNATMRANQAARLLAEADGGLWIGTPVEMCYLPDGRPESGMFSPVGTNLGVAALASGSGDVVWALSSGRNELFHIVSRKVESRFEFPGSQPIRSFLCDERGRVIVVVGNDLYTLADALFVPWPEEAAQRVPADVIARRSGGGLWIADGTRITRLNGAGRIDTPDMTAGSRDAPQMPITFLMEDRTGRLWTGTRNGAVHYFGAESGWRQVTPKRSRALGAISCIHEDFEGMIWVGTVSGFLHQIKPRLITAWSLPGTGQESVAQTVCAARDGSVWLGTDGGGAYRFKDGDLSRYGARHGLSNATVMAIFEDRQSDLWFGTLGGLFRLQGERLKPELESIMSGQPVPALFEDRAGNLWFGTSGAVIRKRGEEIRVYKLDEALRASEVRAIAEGRDGEIWIGTRNAGLFRLQNDLMEKERGFPRPVAATLHCDDQGVLWVGTMARGLYRFQNGRARNWMTSHGLPSNMLFTILEDEGGTLWMSSNEGVFGLSKGELRRYTRDPSAPLLAIHLDAFDTENWSAGSGQPAAARGPDGRLWFPFAHGVLSFDPKTLMRSRPDLPVLIEEVLVDGSERSYSRDEPVRILSGARRLEFYYTIADLDAPGRLKFRYQLEGLDEKWVDGGAQRSASYGPLPPGNYRFRVISAGSGNVWKETANPLRVEIVPRLWERRWFQGLSALLLLGAVALTVRTMERAKARRRLERLEMQHAMEKERRRIARDLHDDLGSGLTEIMLLGELAQRNPPAETREQVVAMTKKTRQLATAMDEVVWTVNPKNDFVPNLASYICDYSREFFRATPVPCRIDADETLPQIPVTAFTRHNLFLAVKEALNNAARHSGASEVWLRVHCDPSRLIVSVEDNGRGFEVSTVSGEGDGLQNMRTRLEAVGGRTEIESRPGAGTLIRFCVPLLPQNGERAASD